MDIPKIGLGTWKIDNSQMGGILPLAYDIGYRLFDTAWIYGNEAGLGEALSSLRVSRDTYWVSTKVRFDYVPNYQKHQFVEKDFLYTTLENRFYNSLLELKTEYVDLVFLHWPTSYDNDAQVFENLLQFKKEGRILHLGLSNFPRSYLEKMVSTFGGEVEFAQFERHAFLGDDLLEDYLREKKIHAMAYSPLGHQHLLKNKELISLAEKTGISISKLCLAYLLKKGFIVIPKACSAAHLKENYECLTIQLSDDIVSCIDSLAKNYRYNNPPFAPKWN